jgi:regulator of replication initiation timing
MTWQAIVDLNKTVGSLVASVGDLRGEVLRQIENVSRLQAEIAEVSKHLPCCAITDRVIELETARVSADQSRREVKAATASYRAIVERVLWLLAGGVVAALLANGPQLLKVFKFL